jgi:hypothetical protein
MAKKASKNGLNLSQLIREYVTANPDAGPTAVAEALNAQHGTKISAQFVSTIKSNSRRKGKGGGIKRRGRKPGRPAAASTARSGASDSLSTDDLKAAKRFILQLGGVQKAKNAVSILGDLLD